MKTNVVEIKNSGTGIREALNEAEHFAEYQKFEKKEALRIRLLAEEMMGLVKNIVGKFDARFWAEGEDKDVQLCLEADVHVDREQRDALLAMATDGKNLARRGFMGMLTAIFEACMQPYDVDGAYGVGYFDYGGFSDPASLGYERLWTLTAMRERAEVGRREKPEEWDGLERSIVASLADEVLVGVKAGKVQLIIKKHF